MYNIKKLKICYFFTTVIGNVIVCTASIAAMSWFTQVDYLTAILVGVAAEFIYNLLCASIYEELLMRAKKKNRERMQRKRLKKYAA